MVHHAEDAGDEVEIRLAVASDAVRRATLRWHSRAEDAPDTAGPMDEFVSRASPRFAECFDRGRLAWVAATGDDLCGHLFLRPVEKVPDPIMGASHLAYVTNFYVTPQLRSRGVGGALLHAMRGWADAIGHPRRVAVHAECLGLATGRVRAAGGTS